MPETIHPVLQLRVALTTREYERLVKFYCDGLGMEPAAVWNNDGGCARPGSRRDAGYFV